MTTGVLRNPDFLRFLSSHVANELGANISRVALPLVAVLVLHAGPAQVGALSSLQTAAFLLVGLPAGVWVDRMRKRRVMMASDVTKFVLFGGIPVAAALGVLSIELMFVIALLAGVSQVFNDVADQTYLPDLVSTGQLGDGNAKLEVVRSAALLAGPGLGGMLVQLLGASPAMVATAIAALASVVFLGTIRAPDKQPADVRRRPLLRSIREGLGYVWRDPLLRAFVASSAIGNLCVSGVTGLSVLFLAQTVGLTPGTIGLLLMSSGVGGLLGGLTGSWLTRKYGIARMTWLVATIGAPFGLILPLTQPDWRVVCFAVTSIMLTWSATLSNVGQLTYRQTVTPDHLLGRVNASMRFMARGVMPVGALLGGLIAQQVGVRQALWLLMIGKALAWLPLLFSPLPRMRDYTEVQARS
ncbi:MFS transporter [Nonomuraea candida]|uniref:MFS transporter n=1 Tax=Nonomuraea candida TaxID=359159 RepID=UPI0005B90901|nr:MFS transporter [Nonomuraea candida]